MRLGVLTGGGDVPGLNPCIKAFVYRVTAAGHEVVEWHPEGDMAWSSVTGIDQRGRWRLRDTPDGGTRITFRFAYGVAGGGVWGLISERVASRWMRGNFKQPNEGLLGQLPGVPVAPHVAPHDSRSEPREDPPERIPHEH